ncbi:Protein CBR-ZIP-8 [Caenorhabditis briggsae]|uniref:BZIP domain-containing protein n=2 Tax=Caenorhabditis briggsae TaxID=6238 RepID=A0AAE9EF09_CAEBR|nr:Protein CBR-ZIP-8 [Caenorhabditis briggsae]ULT99439.1 hypothetical protein L3Y34_000633 [Caenorhabditis briggsae]UMM22116.1 hypothetical protein L5515_003492 [Caenorhabditis briggsae]CAP28688.1 Protein CBR-ZIP-8 [Caenorhabditis briggsae]
MQPHGYPQMNFDQSQAAWNQAAWSHAFAMSQSNVANTPGGVYPGYIFGHSESSSGSDESMNSRGDPKMSPRYREKRQKNNLAAKKSRKVRKEREMNFAKENQELKEKCAETTKLYQRAVEDVDKMREALNRLVMENNELKVRLAALENGKYQQHNVLREVTNANHYNIEPKYELERLG